MEDSNRAIYDGELIKATQPVVPVESRGLMYGDGCFETLRLYEGSFFKLDAHLSRFKKGASFLGLDYPSQLQPSLLQKQVETLLQKNKLRGRDAVIRIQLWREGSRGYYAEANHRSHYSVLATPVPQSSTPVSLATVDIRRIPAQSLPPEFKLCNNINYIIAARQAAAKRADDALMQTVDGFLSETTIANVFWMSGNTVYTPSSDCDLLPGISRKIVLNLLKQREDIQIVKGRFKVEDIYKAETVWICNSVREIMEVIEIDGHQFNVGHPFLNELKSLFKSYVRSELYG